MKRKWIVWIGVLIVLAIGFSMLRGRAQLNGNQLRAFNRPVNAEMVMTVKKGSLEKTVATTGYLAPQNEKSLSFTQNGKVAKVYVREGDRVKKGDLLIQLDHKGQELNYIRAQRAYDAAKINGSPADLREQEANLRIAKDDLDSTSLQAPFGGRVTKLDLEAGDFIAAGQMVVTLADDSRYKIEVSVDESDSHLIQVGQSVKISMDALPGREFFGEVKEIPYQTQNVNGIVNVPVTVVITKVEPEFRPGYSTQLDIIVSSLADQVVVPMTAVFNDQGQETVMKVVNKLPVPTRVKTGLHNGVEVVVTEGVEPGDTIVTNAYEFAGVDPAEQQRQLMMGGGPNRGDD